MKYTDLMVAGSVEYVQQMLNHVFVQNGFEIQWHGPLAGKAVKGSKGANFAVGAFAQYYELDFEIVDMRDNTVAVRVIKATTGMMGGVIGVMKVKKQYEGVINMLTTYFQQQGTFQGRTDN